MHYTDNATTDSNTTQIPVSQALTFHVGFCRNIRWQFADARYGACHNRPDAGELYATAQLQGGHLRSKDILSLAKNEVQHSINRVLQGLDAELQQASQGTLLFPVPVLLQRISKLCKLYPSVKVFILQSRVKLVWELLAQECERAIESQDELSIPQLASTQASLGLYHDKFWSQLGSMRFCFRDSMAAVNTVHAYAALYNCNMAPHPSTELQKVFIAGIVHHIDGVSALGLSNACWALSKLQVSGLEALWPQVQRAVARLCQSPEHMHPEDVACMAYALGQAQRPLGCACEPFVGAVQKASSRMTGKQVARTLRGMASMGLSAGPAHIRLMQAVEKQMCGDVIATGQMPYLVITIKALADSKLPVCSVHEALMHTLHNSLQSMNPAFVAAAMSACGKMYQLGSAHQQLVQPLCVPLEDAVRVSADRMDAKAVSNAVTGLVKLNGGLGTAREPLFRAVMREAELMPPWALSATLMAIAMIQRELGEQCGSAMPALSAALRSCASWDGVRSRAIGEVFWAVGMLRMDPGGRSTGRLLDAAESSAEGMSVYDAERVIVGLSWLQSVYTGKDIKRRVGSLRVAMQGIAESACK